MTRSWHVAALSLALLLLAGAAATAAEIDAKRLMNADKEAGNWLTYHGSYKSWHYSALAEINTKNVGSLREAWSHVASRSVRGLQSYPLAADGAVLLRVIQPGLGARRRDRRGAVAVQAEAQRGPGRQADPFAVQPRHRARLRQRLHGYARRQAGADRHEDRQGQVGNEAGQLGKADGRVYRRAAAREGHGHRRRAGRRVARPRPDLRW